MSTVEDFKKKLESIRGGGSDGYYRGWAYTNFSVYSKL